MSARIRLILSLTLALGAGAAPLAAQQLKTFTGWASDVTPDGAVVVGRNSNQAVYWRWQLDPAPVPIGGSSAVAVSDDGTVIAGDIPNPVGGAQTAARWTAQTGWVVLGGFDTCTSLSTAYDISGDGKQIVGLAWIGCNARAFRWTEGVGIELLDELGLGSNRCSTISSDGEVMGGFANAGLILNRSPSVWVADKTGEIWPALVGEINGLNNDGSVQLGTAFTTLPTRAFYSSVATGFVDLGSLQAGWKSSAIAISEDGGTIVGFDSQGLSRKAWIRQSPSSTLVALQSHLTSLGIPNVPVLEVASACSDSGRTIVGGGAGSGFIASQQKEAWQRLPGGTAGSNGTPVLWGTGTLAGGSSATLDLTHAKPSGTATLVVGLGPLNAAFKAGVLVPQPNYLLFGFPLDADGALHFEFTWPASIPSGVSLWYQAWIADAAGPKGFSSSNGLKSTAP